MKRLQRATVVASLVDAMDRNGSWCGGTHVQKACFILQELLNVPLGYEFKIYKYGPYSFNFNDELAALRADDVLELYVRDPGYGPSYCAGDLLAQLKSKYPKTYCRYQSEIDFVAKAIGDKGVGDLERIATALYIRLDDKALEKEEAAKKLTRIKPHIPMASALDAFEEADRLREKAMLLTE